MRSTHIGISRRYLYVAVAAAALATSALVVASPAGAQTGPVLGAGDPDAIAGEYIVAFEDGTDSAADLIARYGGEIAAVFDSIDAVHALMDHAAAERLAGDPAVSFVEQNQVVRLPEARPGTTGGTQADPPSWGLDRIDQRSLPLDGSYTYPNAGAGVTAFIIDTGIWLGHEEFTGRLAPGFSSIVPGGEGDGNDCHGHGTHVAGTVGGTDYGVAKQVTLVPVQVLSCVGFGTTAGVVAGVDWVTGVAQGPAVANMSLGGDPSQALDMAVEASVFSGVTFAVAAGNDDTDACSHSPAAAPSAITVGSTDIDDARSSFSNFGDCVDIFAPGRSITSAFLAGQTAVFSGTSMASPHVAGAAAVYLSAHPRSDPERVAAVLTRKATKGAVTDPQASPNLLLFLTR